MGGPARGCNSAAPRGCVGQGLNLSPYNSSVTSCGCPITPSGREPLEKAVCWQGVGVALGSAEEKREGGVGLCLLCGSGCPCVQANSC